jgi:hypothetical protein
MNSIWKDKSKTPEKSFRKIYYEYTGLDNSIGCEINNSYWYPSSNTIRWCYLDDLLSQSHRIEQLEKALKQIIDYTIGNGLACIATSKIEEILRENNIHTDKGE